MALSLSPEQRRLRAQAAAYTRWSEEDSREGTKPARAAYMRRFVDQVDPDRVLPEPERERRAKAALRAHMARMALASSRARAKKAAVSDEAAARMALASSRARAKKAGAGEAAKT